MKRFILLLLVISATALSAQDYQYFTAKQGIPKAMEIAKQYFQSDSVELYMIRCLMLDEDAFDYNDSTGKSLTWYYKVCNLYDSCMFFRIREINLDFESDSVIVSSKWKYEFPILVKEIIIDSDSLLNCKKNCAADWYLDKFSLIVMPDFANNPFGYDPVWGYSFGGSYPGDLSAGYCYINAKTCDCDDDILYVFENKNNSAFVINSEPNTDNITIEINSDLFQNAELNLYNQVGVLVFADKLNDKSYQLNTYNYPSGLYLLQIKYGGNVMTKTVMVVH